MVLIHNNPDGAGILGVQSTTLRLLLSEAFAQPLLSVVLEGWAAHDGPQLAMGPRGHLTGFGLSLVAAALFAGRLVEPRLNVALPILVEVAVGDDIVPLGRHG